MICIKEQLPSVEEFNDLTNSVGWGTEPEQVVKNALAHTLYAVCAYDGERIIGHARLIGDGALFAYVQDVMVRPEAQKQGVGKKLMQCVVNRIDEMKKESPNLRAYLGASVGKEAFYRQFGVEVRRDAGLGEGMVRF